jgi:hypothetical protein
MAISENEIAVAICLNFNMISLNAMKSLNRIRKLTNNKETCRRSLSSGNYVCTLLQVSDYISVCLSVCLCCSFRTICGAQSVK